MILIKLISLSKFLVTIFVFITFFTNVSHSYVGLGPLIPILGSIIVWIFVTLIAVLGFVVYPVKKILDKVKNKKKKQKNI